MIPAITNNSQKISDIKLGREIIPNIAYEVARSRYNWKYEWAIKVQSERPRDLLPRGIKRVAANRFPMIVFFDEYHSYVC